MLRDLSRGDGLGRFPNQGSPLVAQFAIRKSPWQQTEHQQRTEQRQDQRIGKSQRAGPLSSNLRRLIDLAERIFTDRTIVAETLDVQKTSVGLEADLPQSWKIIQPFLDGEVACVIDGRLRSQAPAFLGGTA